MRNGTEWVAPHEGDAVYDVICAIRKMLEDYDPLLDRLSEMPGDQKLNIKIIGPLTGYDLKRLMVAD